jgi:hypothetical protein
MNELCTGSIATARFLRGEGLARLAGEQGASGVPQHF